MRVTTDEMEIRGKETKTSKQGNEYILVRAEDEAGKMYELCDKTMSRYEQYRKGMTCRLLIDVEMFTTREGKKVTNLTVVGIAE